MAMKKRALILSVFVLIAINSVSAQVSIRIDAGTPKLSDVRCVDGIVSGKLTNTASGPGSFAISSNYPGNCYLKSSQNIVQVGSKQTEQFSYEISGTDNCYLTATDQGSGIYDTVPFRCLRSETPKPIEPIYPPTYVIQYDYTPFWILLGLVAIFILAFLLKKKFID